MSEPAQKNLPTIASNHFEMVMAHYEHCAGLIKRVGTTQYTEHASAVRAHVLPTISDFIADTELACARALAGHPRLLALWRGVFVEERFSEAKVRATLPQEWLTIAEICGGTLWKKIPNVQDYFRLTSDQQAARHRERMEALELSRKRGRKAEKLAQEQRNKRRRERYAELKKEQTEVCTERKEAA